jgi:hypothetical protein
MTTDRLHFATMLAEAEERTADDLTRRAGELADKATLTPVYETVDSTMLTVGALLVVAERLGDLTRAVEQIANSLDPV